MLIEQTDKRWKKTILVGVGMLILGVILVPTENAAAGGFLMFFGLITVIYARARAWWHNG